MAVGTTTAVLLGLGAAAGGAGIGMAVNSASKQKVASSPMPLPQAPSPADAIGKAEEVIKKKKTSMSQSIYTSPLGIAGEAQVARKTLLGQ